MFAWGIAGILALAPISIVVASRSPSAVAAVIGILAIPLLVRAGIPAALDRRLVGLIGGIMLIMAAASALAGSGADAALERSAKSAGLMIAGVLAAAAILHGGPFCSPSLKLAVAGAFAAGLALLGLEVLADGPIYRLLHGIDAAVLIDGWTFDRAALALAILLWPAVACLPAKWVVRAGILLSVFAVAVILFTESQTGPLVVIGSLFAFLATYVLPRAIPLAFGVLTAAYIVVAPWLFLAIHSRASAFFGDWTAASAGARLDIWRVVAKFALERPFTGWGADALRRMENIFSPQEAFMTAAGKTAAFHPHNFALQAWLDLGIAGALLVIALILLGFFTISKLPRPLAATGSAMLVAILIAGSLSPGLWQGWWLGTMVLAVCQFVLATRTREPFAIEQIGQRPAS